MADGLTKPLAGQAFFRFVEDLGIKRSTAAKSVGPQIEHAEELHGGGDAHTAMKAIMAGSLLVSSAQAMEEESTESSELTPILVTGAVLMTLGAVYAGQLLCEATQCCLRRLRMPTEEEVHQERRRRRGHQSGDQEVTTRSEASEEENEPADEPVSVSSRRRAMEHGIDGVTRRKSSSQRGLKTGSAGATNSAGSTSLRLTRRSGSSTIAVSASSMGSGTQSGSSSAAGSLSRCMPSSSGSHGATGNDAVAEESMSLPMTTRSGSHGAMVSGDVPAVGRASRRMSTRSGSHGAAVAAENSSANGDVDPGITNPWNLFQHQNRNRGLTSRMLAILYRNQKSQGPGYIECLEPSVCDAQIEKCGKFSDSRKGGVCLQRYIQRHF